MLLVYQLNLQLIKAPNSRSSVFFPDMVDAAAPQTSRQSESIHSEPATVSKCARWESTFIHVLFVCCCLATLKSLWKHVQWFKNRWLLVHHPRDKSKNRFYVRMELSQFYFMVTFLKIVFVFLNHDFFLFENEVRCSDVLLQRQTDAYSLTNPPFGLPFASASAMNGWTCGIKTFWKYVWCFCNKTELIKCTAHKI